jgi:hypothetical protein
MKITLCGSIAFYNEMEAIKARLEKMDHEVKLPPSHIKNESGIMIPIKQYYSIRKATDKTDGWIWDRKADAMRWHFDKVAWSDVILVVNHDKNGIKNYIGGNTLLEMGLAFHLKKPIYLYFPIPEVTYKEEILGMKPVIIDEDLSKVR